jgi:hypothetical protein
MARTTDTLVKEIISLRVLTDTTPFITTANLLVTQYLSASGLSDALLAEIEKYLAAHLVALHPNERPVTSQKLSIASDTYAGKFGMSLDSTQFGQTLKILDSTGTLEDLGKGASTFTSINADYGY